MKNKPPTGSTAPSAFDPARPAPKKRKREKRNRRRQGRTPEAGGRVANSGANVLYLRTLRPWFFLMGATLIAYLPALNGDFIWDDDNHITGPALQSLDGLARIWFQLGATAQYYPLLHSAFWFEHQLWGNAVLGYHLTNVILHAVAACLVVMIARRLSLAGAWLAGFVFALHPVCVEAVAWISEQKSTLSAVFYLSSALAYLHFDQTRRRSRYFLALGLFVLALLSKTVTATLPAVLLVVLWWQRGRRLAWKRDVLPLLAWFPLGAAAGLLTAWVERKFIGAEGAHYTLTAIQRLLLAGRVIWFYAGKLLWPADLMFTYPRWTIDPGQWWQWLFPAGVLAVLIVLCLVARRHRGPLAGFLVFAGTLFPVLGFLNVYPFRFSWVADHFQYLASLGVIVPLTSGLMLAAQRWSLGKRGTVALASTLVAILGVLTWRQSGTYRNAETLYRKTLERNPASYMAHTNLGNILMFQPGRLAEAIAEFEAALRTEPDDADTHNNLGIALEHSNRKTDAIAEYATAVRLEPTNATARYDLGSALTETPGRLQDGIAQLQEALRNRPDFEAAHLSLAAALSRMPDRLPEAAAEYWAALQIQPGNANAHLELGDILTQMPGRTRDAMIQYEAALRIRPGWEPARERLQRLRTKTE